MIIIKQHNKPEQMIIGIPMNKITNIVIIVGAHGNEAGPVKYMRQRYGNNDLIQFIKGGMNYSIITINPYGVLKGTRVDRDGYDLNRQWPHHPSLKQWLPYIKNADIVIDFHEAVGYRQCNQSNTLGQTIFTNHNTLYPWIHSTVGDINKYLEMVYNVGTCKKWAQLSDVPYAYGTLDQHCTDVGTPYILFELAGQNDIEPLEIRFATMDIIMNKITKMAEI